MTTLHARREHFGVLLYSTEAGDYLRVDDSHANAIQHAVSSGAGLEQLSAIGLYEHYDAFRWIDNPRAYPTALSAPLKVFFNITKRCNLHCHHCYNNSGERDSPEMSTSRVIEVIEDLERLGIFRITLAGGEPTYHRGFHDIMQAVEASSLTASMVTNGITLNDELVSQLACASRIRTITISVDGATAVANDTVRGHGTFDRIVAGVRRLVACYPHALHLRMTLTRPTIASLQHVPALLASVGVHNLKVNRCNPYGRAAHRPDLVPTAEEYEAAYDELRGLAEAHDFDIEVPSKKYVIESSGVLGLCRAGEETAEIDGDGSVYPCSFSWGRFCAGNLTQTSTDSAILALQHHTINNPFCMGCRGRGGLAIKPRGHVTRIPYATSQPPASTI